MLLRDKYIPKKFHDSFFHKDTIKRLHRVSEVDTFCNMFIYGRSGCGKYTLTLMLLQSIYDDSIYNRKTKELLLNNGKTIELIASNYHYEIYFNENYCYEDSSINQFLKEICKTKSIINNNYKIIVLKNIEFLSKETYQIIKMINEKYYENVKFILLSQSLNNVPSYLKGYFFFMRIQIPKMLDIQEFFWNIVKKEKIEIAKKELESIVNKENNINSVFLHLDLAILKPGVSFESPLELKKRTLVAEIKKKRILEVRKTLYDIISHNISKQSLILDLTYMWLEGLNDDAERCALLEFAGKIMVRLNKSYKNMYHLEYFVMELMNY